jgi:hypothetical protein
MGSFMPWCRQQRGLLRLICECAILLVLTSPLFAGSEQRGQVTFNGLPVPGATVTATQDSKNFSAITDLQGFYVFPDLADGTWTIDVQMFGFAILKQNVTARATGPVVKWQMKLLPLEQIKADVQAAPANEGPAPREAKKAEVQPAQPSVSKSPDEEDDLSQRAADGLLINGSANNSAASPFGQAAAFGNFRNGGKSMYRGGLGVIMGNSALDARPFSLAGQNTPTPTYNRVTSVLTFGGPLQIPHLFKNGPNLFVGYQWTRNNSNTIQSALMPSLAERNGAFSQPIVDPLTGSPFPGDTIPQSRISPQAQALLKLYPLPNVDNNSRYNYQIPLLNPTHQDALQTRFNQTLGRSDQIFGGFALQSIRADNSTLFGFSDTTDTLGINTNLNWTHRINQDWFLNLGYDYSRLASRVTPYFENRVNVSELAGIEGNDQTPANWGPPSLVFSGGTAGLSDAQSSFNRDQTSSVSYSMMWNRRAHNVAFGVDYRRRQFNYLAQQDARGTLGFTGAATGSDFADFLLGIPDTASIAFGNADKYFRESLYDAYFQDDWRVTPALTVNAGMRWEYAAPVTELHDRLANLDIAPGFTAASPVVASDPAATLTGQTYPSSLVQPDKLGFEPRLGVAWHPLAGSSLVVRAGYGIYRDTSVYQTLALQMAQQPPLSKTLSVQNTAANPFTMAKAFLQSPGTTANTFAVDPNFRVGYAQNWQLSIQRDLPGSLQMTATYLGIKGTRGTQAFLPNTFPVGAASPCPACPVGFVYLTSNGSSSREAAQLQLRRRLHSGIAASMQYTFSKSIDDDAALGGPGSSGNNQGIGQNASSTASPAIGNLAIAQNWLDLRAERGLSTFDQRHLLSLQMQYTTGMGLAGGTLLSGWKGALSRDWTLATQISAGSGLPQTPIYMVPVPGTAVTGTIRPDCTGAPIYAAPTGLFLNPAAFSSPLPGQWGNAGKGSITGPAQFTLNASLARTFRIKDPFNLDLRIDAVNALNHVTFTAWNTTINSAQFGLPVAANSMRSVQTTLRLRF